MAENQDCSRFFQMQLQCQRYQVKVELSAEKNKVYFVVNLKFSGFQNCHEKMIAPRYVLSSVT
jgi:hypothetical protein